MNDKATPWEKAANEVSVCPFAEIPAIIERACREHAESEVALAMLASVATVAKLQVENEALRKIVASKGSSAVSEHLKAQLAERERTIARLREALEQLLATCPHEQEGAPRALAALNAREALAATKQTP